MSIKFTRKIIDKANKCEACSVFDIDGDGKNEIVCGEFYYKYPDFGQKHKFCTINYDGNYVWDFSDFPMDVDGDGKMEIITGSWWGEGLYYRHRPQGQTTEQEWETVKICELKEVETIRYLDIDNCGTPEIFPNMPGDVACFFKLNRDENGRGLATFTRYDISKEAAGHGMGFGDVTGNGKTDLLLCDGWLEQPEDLFSGEWIRHYDWNVPMASVPILCHDVNKDGINDIIIGAGHNYGIWWLEQTISDSGERSFVTHEIDTSCSQYHDMQLVDVDGDGEKELITGARFYAHNGNDPGEKNPETEHPYPIGTYVFKIEVTEADAGAKAGANVKSASGEDTKKEVKFVKNVLNFGDYEETSGTGIYFWVEDMRGTGRKDIICPGKEGLYIFENECK